MEDEKKQKQIDVAELPLMKDLIAYYDDEIPQDVVGFRLNHSAPELAFLWHQMKSKGISTEDYYKDKIVGDLYLADLTKYQLSLEINGLIDKMLDQMVEKVEENHKNGVITNVLEFGGGIANFSIRCKERFGNKVNMFYYDLDGSIKDYAIWRIEKYLSEITILNEESEPLKKGEYWDFVNIMDVLEHINGSDIGLIIENLGETADRIFINPSEIPYNSYFPQHITRYDVSPFFKKSEGYLWKNRKLLQEKILN